MHLDQSKKGINYSLGFRPSIHLEYSFYLLDHFLGLKAGLEIRLSKDRPHQRWNLKKKHIRFQIHKFCQMFDQKNQSF